MPSLPLPHGNSQLGGGDFPVTGIDDVLEVLPSFLQTSDPSPVRDALLAGLTAALVTYQERAGYAAAQSDVLRATGSYQVGLGQDRGVYRQATETVLQYRARILSIPNLVTPAAILAAVNSILAPFTTVRAQVFESILDRWYVRKGPGGGAPPTTGFHSFVYRTSTKNPSSPYYPDRLYEQDAAENDGLFRPQSNPGGARVFGDTVGRMFMFRIPPLSAIDGNFVAVYDTSENVPYPQPTIQPGAGMFVYRAGSAGSPYGAYVRSVSATAASVYAALVNTISRLHAQSIRWRLEVDPTLTS